MYRPIQVTSPTLRDYWSLAISSGRSRRTHATLQIRLTGKSGSLKSPGDQANSRSACREQWVTSEREHHHVGISQYVS